MKSFPSPLSSSGACCLSSALPAHVVFPPQSQLAEFSSSPLNKQSLASDCFLGPFHHRLYFCYICSSPEVNSSNPNCPHSVSLWVFSQNTSSCAGKGKAEKLREWRKGLGMEGERFARGREECVGAEILVQEKQRRFSPSPPSLSRHLSATTLKGKSSELRQEKSC